MGEQKSVRKSSSVSAEVLSGLARVLVLDFGSQYTHLICRRCREIGVYSELHACCLSLEEIIDFNPTCIILSGGPNSVYEEGSPHVSPGVWRYITDRKLPVLGICYGQQEIAHTFGGEVIPGNKREYGHADLTVTDKTCPLFANIDTVSRVWMSHGDKVSKLPEGFRIVAVTGNSDHAAIWDPVRKWVGIQFHPEVTHSDSGLAILKGFLVDVCGIQAGQWNMECFATREIAKLKEMLGDHMHVVAAVSGGVDSSVAAALVARVAGKRFHPFMVDTGLLRLNEAEEVKERLERHIPGLNLTVLDESEEFLKHLDGVKEPEKKRKIIGRLFVESFEKATKAMGLEPKNCLLLQGTLYPDVIESTSLKGPSHIIKTHHNVGGLPERMQMAGVMEPLRMLFKDEVRKLGVELGLHPESVMRHPFPGPGLGIRIMDCVDKPKADTLRLADAIYMEELKSSGHYSKTAQAFAVLMPTVKTVGVMGDCRTYETVVALRAVESSDFMTADWYEMPYSLLKKISTRIINEVPGINRVLYDVSSKPPATIEWE